MSKSLKELVKHLDAALVSISTLKDITDDISAQHDDLRAEYDWLNDQDILSPEVSSSLLEILAWASSAEGMAEKLDELNDTLDTQADDFNSKVEADEKSS